MKTLLNFLTEAKESTAVVQAKRLGLKTDGHGGWYNAQGEFVAKTEKGELKFYDKGQKTGEKDQPKARPKAAELANKVQAKKQEVSGGKKPVAPDQVSSQTGKPLTVVFGRFNPPTTGHQKLFSSASNMAAGGDLKIYPSRSQDPKKNPLDPSTKIGYLKKMFPNYEDNIVDSDEMRSIFDVLKVANEDGYKEITIVVGSDRLSEFKNLANKYNGELYTFDQINVLSAGERDAESDSVEGMSASKLRKAAASDNFDEFKRGVPKSLDDKEKKNLFNALQKSMKIAKEEEKVEELWQIAPKLDQESLRENYVKELIYKIGDIVENLNTGLVGRIIRRGSNHLICLTKEGFMFKSWIRDIKEYTEVKMSRIMRDKTHPNTLVGTDGFKKYVEKMSPGNSYGKQFINKYKKKKS
jgi:hypothetical protein